MGYLKWKACLLRDFLSLKSSFLRSTVRIKGIRIPLDSKYSNTMRTAIVCKKYEREEINLLKKSLEPSDIVLELGTGVGLISTFCAKRIGSNRVYTYEANPAMQPFILKTFELNKVNPTCEISSLGEEAGTLKFYPSKDFWASSSIDPQNGTKPIEVPIQSLNDTIKRINPSFIIIDIEGGEYELFQYIDFHCIQKVLLETHPEIIGDTKTEFVKNRLYEAGYTSVNDQARNETLWIRTPTD